MPTEKESWRCYMKYSKEEQLAIGKRLYNHEISHKEAMIEYGVSDSSLDKYTQAYKKSQGIPLNKTTVSAQPVKLPSKSISDIDIDAYMAMSKEELIKELVQAKANELRARKGYEVKGVGANKEFIPLNNKNSKL